MKNIGWLILLATLLTACAPATATQPPASPSPTAAPSSLTDSPSDATAPPPADEATMVHVPAGEFIMGDDHGMTDEQPAHPVYLDAFWLDRTEVTNEAYRKCVESGACDLPSDTSYFDDAAYANHPVVFVSWRDAVAYCSFADKRLPTEAEWEKAATWNPLTDEKYQYPWGNEYDCSKANFDDETGLDDSLMQVGQVSCDGFVRSSPAGNFPQGASPYGALDMAGNVWEWVHDAFIETDPLLLSGVKNYYAVSPYKNPQGVDPSITEYRLMRGGSWNWTFGYGRSAYRLWFGLDDSYDGVGFRCAESASGK